jgi:hypothetical protein
MLVNDCHPDVSRQQEGVENTQRRCSKGFYLKIFLQNIEGGGGGNPLPFLPICLWRFWAFFWHAGFKSTLAYPTNCSWFVGCPSYLQLFAKSLPLASENTKTAFPTVLLVFTTQRPKTPPENGRKENPPDNEMPTGPKTKTPLLQNVQKKPKKPPKSLNKKFLPPTWLPLR